MPAEFFWSWNIYTSKKNRTFILNLCSLKIETKLTSFLRCWWYHSKELLFWTAEFWCIWKYFSGLGNTELQVGCLDYKITCLSAMASVLFHLFIYFTLSLYLLLLIFLIFVSKFCNVSRSIFCNYNLFHCGITIHYSKIYIIKSNIHPGLSK